jgi:hypothetical protein
MLAAAFLLPIGSEKKRPGKIPSRFRKTCCNSFIPNEAISDLPLPPFKPKD